VENTINEINEVRLIINKPYSIDNIGYIFHPIMGGRPIASLDGERVESSRNQLREMVGGVPQDFGF
jgi:hypothetical protein